MGTQTEQIYTRTGASGTTGLGDGSRVAKTASASTLTVTPDDSTVPLGVILAAAELPQVVVDALTEVQPELFDRVFRAIERAGTNRRSG